MNPIPARLPVTLGAAVALALGLGACGQEEDTSGRRPLGQQQTPPMEGQLPEGHPAVPGMGDGEAAIGADARDLPRAVAVHLDSGNAAYRAGDYPAARRQYRAAVGEDSTSAAAWFGVYMAERALGNELAADSALRQAGDLGGASEVHASPSADGGEEAGEMPHPPMETPDR